MRTPPQMRNHWEFPSFTLFTKRVNTSFYTLFTHFFETEISKQ